MKENEEEERGVPKEVSAVRVTAKGRTEPRVKQSEGQRRHLIDMVAFEDREIC